MATIIGGIGTSHVPTIGMAFDRASRTTRTGRRCSRATSRWRSGWRRRSPTCCSSASTTTRRPSSSTTIPTFALGVSEEYAIADEGLGVRRIPTLKGHVALSRHIARSLVEDEFDLTIFQDLPLDHGLHSPLTMMWPSRARTGRAKVFPLVVNVLQHPLPTPMRCFKLGKAIRKAIESYPEDLERRDRRHRRPVAPADRRARRLQRRDVGPRVPRPHRHATPSVWRA